MGQAETKGNWRQAIRGNVLAMGLVSLLTDFSSEMMNPLLPVFIAALVGGAKVAFWVGITEGIAETTASLLKLFSGRLSDKLGKRKALVIVGYGLSSLLRPMMALAGMAWQITAIKFGDRVGKGIRTSPRDALIGDSVSPDVRGLAFSFHRSMDHLGAVLGPLAAMVMLYFLLGREQLTLGWAGSGKISVQETDALRWLFAAAIIPGVLSMLALIFMVREIGVIPHGKDASQVDQTSQARLPRNFFAFVIVATIFALGNSSDMFLLLLAWSRFGMSLMELILLWIVLHISKIIFSIPGGILSDRLGRKPVIVVGWLVYSFIYLGMGWLAAEQWHFWALFILYGFYYGMTEGAEKAMVTDLVPSQSRGTAFGVFHGAIGLAALPASLLFGVIWSFLGEPMGSRLAFSVGAGLSGLAALLLLFIRTGAAEKK